MSGTLIGYARCSTLTQELMSRPTMYRTLQRSQASPGTVTLCPLASRISHIRPIFGEYFGNPWCPAHARMTMHTNADSC
jgi:hypothetical protein